MQMNSDFMELLKLIILVVGGFVAIMEYWSANAFKGHNIYANF